MLLFLIYLLAIVQRWLALSRDVNANPSYLIWMKSWSTIFVERDAAVLVDMTSMRTSGLRIVSGSLLVTHSQIRWKLVKKFWTFLAITFLSSNSCVVFSRFSLACFSIYWVVAEWETQMCLSCKITPDASPVSESDEEGGKNPKSVEQLCNWFSKTLLNRSTWK